MTSEELQNRATLLSVYGADVIASLSLASEYDAKEIAYAAFDVGEFVREITDKNELDEDYLLSSQWKPVKFAKSAFEKDVCGLSVEAWRSSKGPWWCLFIEGDAWPVDILTRGQLARLIFAMDDK